MLMLYLIDGMPAVAQFLISDLELLDIAVALRALRQHDGADAFRWSIWLEVRNGRRRCIRA